MVLVDRPECDLVGPGGAVTDTGFDEWYSFVGKACVHR